MRPYIFLPIIILFAGCGAVSISEKPDITFIGVTPGTLETAADEMKFTDRFQPEDQNIIGVVVFGEPMNGAKVQATWFSPDERRMPLGRTSIDMASGATVARFSFASKELWEPAPYQLRIDAMSGEGENAQTASGSVSFFIGMKDREIQEYRDQFAAWQEADAAQRAVYEARMQREKAVVDGAKADLGATDGTIILQYDFTGDGSEDFLIGTYTDMDDAMMPPSGGGPGLLASGSVDQFLLRDGSGSELLSLRRIRGERIVRAGTVQLAGDIAEKGLVQVTVLPTLTIALSWDGKDGSCSLELRRNAAGEYEATEPVCME